MTIVNNRPHFALTAIKKTTPAIARQYARTNVGYFYNTCMVCILFIRSTLVRIARIKHVTADHLKREYNYIP